MTKYIPTLFILLTLLAAIAFTQGLKSAKGHTVHPLSDSAKADMIAWQRLMVLDSLALNLGSLSELDTLSGITGEEKELIIDKYHYLHPLER